MTVPVLTGLLRHTHNYYYERGQSPLNATNHCEKDPKLRVQIHHVSVGENKLLLPFFLGREDNVDLLCGDR